MNKWFESKNLANYAKTAFLQAQKKIDQVLDIKEEEIVSSGGTKLGDNIADTLDLTGGSILGLTVNTVSDTKKSNENENDFFSSFLNQSSSKSPVPSAKSSDDLIGSRSSSGSRKINKSAQKKKSNETNDNEVKFDEFVNNKTSSGLDLGLKVPSSVTANQLSLSQTSQNESMTNSLGSGVDLISNTTVFDTESNIDDLDEKLKSLKPAIIASSSSVSTNRPLTPTNSSTSSNKGSVRSLKQASSSQIGELEKIEKQSWVQKYVDSNGQTPVSSVQIEINNLNTNNQTMEKESNETTKKGTKL